MSRNVNSWVAGLFYQDECVHHPEMCKFQFGVNGLQVLHDPRSAGGGEHWIVVHWSENQARIYDSLIMKKLRLDPSVAGHLRHLLPHAVGTNVEIWYSKVQQQKNTYDCGICALAFAAEIVAGKDATMSRFNTNRMRAFLIEAFEQSEISSFPTTGGRAGVHD